MWSWFFCDLFQKVYRIAECKTLNSSPMTAKFCNREKQFNDLWLQKARLFSLSVSKCSKVAILCPCFLSAFPKCWPNVSIPFAHNSRASWAGLVGIPKPEGQIVVLACYSLHWLLMVFITALSVQACWDRWVRRSDCHIASVGYNSL